MSSLSAALHDLSSAKGRLAAAKAVTDFVYGPVSGPGWKPKPHSEYKGRSDEGGGGRLAPPPGAHLCGWRMPVGTCGPTPSECVTT